TTKLKPLEQLIGKIDTTPCAPVSFGYKNSWLAIRASDSDVVIQALPVDNPQRANWQSGFVAAYNDYVFLTPALEGWVFLICQRLPELGHAPDTEEWTLLMTSLSQKFGEVQYFGTHRVVGYNAWSKFVNGHEERAYAYCDETLVNRGPQTQGELDLGYIYYDSNDSGEDSATYRERTDLCYPDEEHVMEIAGKWSLNPNTLTEKKYPAGVGWIGTLRRTRN
ncbi:MAG: hypothetical protein JWN70_1108, partial [Planctomycetaceae bacterium]|nr:hypothetical protein [Planctomycetaceae bacterium]